MGCTPTCTCGGVRPSSCTQRCAHAGGTVLPAHAAGTWEPHLELPLHEAAVREAGGRVGGKGVAPVRVRAGHAGVVPGLRRRVLQEGPCRPPAAQAVAGPPKGVGRKLTPAQGRASPSSTALNGHWCSSWCHCAFMPPAAVRQPPCRAPTSAQQARLWPAVSGDACIPERSRQFRPDTNFAPPLSCKCLAHL